MQEMNQQDSLSVIAHELRTSLSATKWVLNMFLNEELGPLTVEQRSFLEKTISNNEHMITLISELIGKHKGDSEDKQYTFATENISDIIKHVLDEFSAWAKQHDITLEWSQPVDSVLAQVEKKKIGSAVRELVSNALKYSKEGSTISVALHTKDDHVEIEVRDTGIGVPEEEQSKLFEKYFRGEKARAMASSGSGLGLYMVKHVAEKHGGSATYAENQPHGSVFTISIPCKQ